MVAAVVVAAVVVAAVVAATVAVATVAALVAVVDHRHQTTFSVPQSLDEIKSQVTARLLLPLVI